jgi:hypothetical protein
MAKIMLASKINCLNSEYPRNSFSLRSPDPIRHVETLGQYRRPHSLLRPNHACNRSSARGAHHLL